MRKYKVILADPPWSYELEQFQSGGRPFKNINEYYDTMSFKQIKELPIKEIMDKDCALFLWSTNSHLDLAIQLMKSWGFSYKTIAFVWVKRYSSGSKCYNYAPWTMQSVEVCLLGIKGKPKRIAKNVKQLVEEVRTKHSKKPSSIYSRIEQLFGTVPKVELFARTRRQGWDAWGNEVPNHTQALLSVGSFNKDLTEDSAESSQIISFGYVRKPE